VSEEVRRITAKSVKLKFSNVITKLIVEVTKWTALTLFKLTQEET
jgi:hypothetical protein